MVNCNITILTTTYNRAKLLPNLYNSLKRQTNNNFIWLVIDDGSSDDTRELIRQWKNEGIVPIDYHFHENIGKMLSHNYGVSICQTECIICIDSDDFLVDTAVEDMINEWNHIKLNNNIGGIVCYKQILDEEGVIKKHREFCRYGNVNLSRLLYNTKIETGLLFRTNVIKSYPFILVDNERFIPEDYCYNQISDNFYFRTLPKDLIVCKYISDGYTKNYKMLIYRNPKGFAKAFNDRIKRFSVMNKRTIMAIIRYIACNMILGNNIYDTLRRCNNTIFGILLLPIGVAYYQVLRYVNMKY